jgi:prepilin-type N-terminal cleavage/methylation domain-containing protein
MNRQHKNRLQVGFSLLELMIVLAIIMVVSAIAVPQMQLAIAQMRLRATATNVNGLIQQLRMQAVRNNRSFTMRTTIVNGQPTLFVDSILPTTPNVAPNGVYDAGEPSVPLPTDIVVFDGVGGPPTAPTLQVVIPPYVNFATNQLLSFNERGLPCDNPPLCNNIAPYVLYMRQTRPLSAPGYAAIVITQAGRVKAFTYQPGTPGTSWY